MSITRCKLCVIPTTRPDTEFVDGVCSACLSYARRKEIDWDARMKQLEQLLDRHHGECIVASSGGKDSTYQAITLKKMGADVVCVTARTCHLTPTGRHNIDNLAKHCATFEVVHNQTTRAKLNVLGLEMVGDISWPEHVAIFTTPMHMAIALSYPLVFYGENPQEAYGGPKGSEEACTMTARWVSEFGGFLGLRPSDLESQIGVREMDAYNMPAASLIAAAGVEAHWLGQYIEWDSARNAEVALVHGMRGSKPTRANWWTYENLDNAQTGIHDNLMYRKYGYGRGAAQISVDVRAGKVTRAEALKWVRQWDGHFPMVYAGVRLSEVLERIGMTHDDLYRELLRWTNRDIFDIPLDGSPTLRPVLKETE